MKGEVVDLLLKLLSLQIEGKLFSNVTYSSREGFVFSKILKS